MGPGSGRIGNVLPPTLEAPQSLEGGLQIGFPPLFGKRNGAAFQRRAESLPANPPHRLKITILALILHRVGFQDLSWGYHPVTSPLCCAASTRIMETVRRGLRSLHMAPGSERSSGRIGNVLPPTLEAPQSHQGGLQVGFPPPL